MSDPTAPDWTRAQLEERLYRPPFNAWLGLQLVDWDGGGITFSLDSRPDLYGHAKFKSLHGGIIATVLDVAASFAVIVRTGESLFTVDIRVDYLRPATAPRHLVRGEVLRLGKSLATADARITTPDGIVVATARALCQQMPDPGS